MILISIIQALAGLYVLYTGISVLNHMTKATRVLIRFAYITLTVSGGAAIASCLVARDILHCVFAVGIAVYLLADHRGRRDDT